MADRRLVWSVPSGSGDIGDSTNYKLEGTQTAGSGVISLGDILIFDGTAQGNAVATTAIDCSTGTSGDGAIQVAAGYRGNIGESGSPVVFHGGQITHQGTGAMWHTNNNVSAAMLGRVTLKQGGGALHLSGRYESHDVTVARGTLVLRTGSQVAVVNTGYELNSASDSRLTIENGVTLNGSAAITNVNINAGVATLQSNISEIVTGMASSVTCDGNMDAVSQLWLAGGTCIFSAQATVDNAYALKGLLDLSRDPRPKTITTLRQWTGSTVNTKNGTGSIEVTNWYTIGAASTVVDGSPGASLPQPV